MAGQMFCRHGSPFFCLQSVPYMFTAIADMVQWMLTFHQSVDFLSHYSDDFLSLGPPSSLVSYNNLQVCIQLCSKLGLPLHSDKLEVRSTFILGIELDSVRLQARLPVDKGERIITLVESWLGKQFCKQKELVPYWPPPPCLGWMFLLAWLTYCVNYRWNDHPIRLNQEFWTLLGGMNFSKGGMGSASSWHQNGLPSLIFKFLPMLLVL